MPSPDYVLIGPEATLFDWIDFTGDLLDASTETINEAFATVFEFE